MMSGWGFYGRCYPRTNQAHNTSQSAVRIEPCAKMCSNRAPAADAVQ